MQTTQMSIQTTNLAPICQATVVGRHAIKNKSSLKFAMPSITIYRDTPSVREIKELRIFSSGYGCIETRQLFDFDPVKQRWNTYGPSKREDIESFKEAKKLAETMLKEIEEANLEPYSGNSGQMETYYAREN